MAALSNFRRNLRRTIESRDITQRRLAEMTGMSHPYLNRVLKGNTTPSLAQCERIAEVLGVKLVELLNDPPPEKTRKAS